MIEEIRYSSECFSLTADELVLLLSLRAGLKDFKSISAKSGIGINKAAKLLVSLKAGGYLEYVPGRPETAKIRGYPQEDEVFRMPLWALFYRRLKRNCSDKIVFSYLLTFTDEKGEVKKRRSEICSVLKMKKNTVNNCINRLVRAGLVRKTGKDGNAICYQISLERPSLFFD